MSDLIKKYSEKPAIRALIQLIPYVGGSLDTLLYEKGNKWRTERLEYLLNDFSEKIETLINKNRDLEDEIHQKMGTEEFYDIILTCVKNSIETRHKEKIQKFSNIMLNYCSPDDSFVKNDVDLMILITTSLSNREFFLLKEIKNDKLVYHQIDNSKIINWEIFKNYLIENNILYQNGMSSPPDCLINQNDLFLYTRLQSQFLVNIVDQNLRGGSLSYKLSTSAQTILHSISYNKEIQIKLSDFGMKYLNWIMNP